MKKLLLALALLLAPSLAWGQCTGVFPTGTVCGNNTGSNNTPRATAISTYGGITALTGDGTATGPGSVPLILATVNSNVGTFGSSTACVTATVNNKGLITGMSAATCAPAFSSVTGNISVNQMNSGTNASSTTFWRGDGTWIGVPAGTGLYSSVRSTTTTTTVASTDCNNAIQAGTGSSGLFTVTLPAVAGFPGGCVITITNGDTGRGKQLIGFPGDIYCQLYSGQTVIVGLINGAWSTISNQGRWRPTGTVAFNVNATSGLDTCASDGLGTGAGAFNTPSWAYAVFSQHMDGGQSSTNIVNANIIGATTTLTSGWTFYGKPAPGYYSTPNTKPFRVLGVTPLSTTVTSSTNGVILFNLQGGAEVQIDQMTVSSTGTGGYCVLVAEGEAFISMPSTGSMYFGQCTGAAVDAAGGRSSWRFAGPFLTLAAMANTSFAIVESGATGFVADAMTINGCTGTVSIGVFVADITARIDMSGFSFTGLAACITGPKGNANLNGVVFTNTAGCTTALPGSGAFVIATGGQCS